jgi:hypothetical protein
MGRTLTRPETREQGARRAFAHIGAEYAHIGAA